MGMWDRLGTVIKSYINGAGETFNREKSGRYSRKDRDYDEAYEELESFLNGEEPKETFTTGKHRGNGGQRVQVPPEIKAAFAELGLENTAAESACKEAYKKLLKRHHPDRHAGNPELMKQATEKTARINAAWDRLEGWFKIGK